jgi:hypothetical protein
MFNAFLQRGARQCTCNNNNNYNQGAIDARPGCQSKPELPTCAILATTLIKALHLLLGDAIAFSCENMTEITNAEKCIVKN